MFPSSRMTLNTGPFDVNMQLIAVALAVTVAVAALAFKSHAARRILDVVCNVRRNARSYVVEFRLINAGLGCSVSHVSHPQP